MNSSIILDNYLECQSALAISLFIGEHILFQSFHKFYK